MENIKNYEIAEDLRQSPEYGGYMESIGWKVIRTQSPLSGFSVFIKKLGPVAISKIQRVKKALPMDEIEYILKKYRVMMVKIEPSNGNSRLMLENRKYRLSNWPLLGTKTSRVNLRPGNKEIFNSFKKDCRYLLRKFKTQYSGVKTVKNNFKEFYEIWKKSSKRKHLWIPPEKDYQSLVNNFGNNVYSITIGSLAGAVILIHKKTAFYYYAGSTAEGIRQNFPYPVVWEAMQEAKKRGCEVWDFEGIYDTRWPNKGWLGFSHFKKSFNGAEIEFPGSFEKWRWPF